jgi:hypothetical protein
MLHQLSDDRVRHDLAPMNFGMLAAVDRRVPTAFWIAMNGDLEITGADPRLNDLFQLGGSFALLVQRRSLRRASGVASSPRVLLLLG